MALETIETTAASTAFLTKLAERLQADGRPETPWTIDDARKGLPQLNQSPANEFNAVRNLAGINCPRCGNKGYLLDLDDEGNYLGRPCPCMTTRANLRRLERSGLADMLTRYTFGRWETPEPWQRKALESAQTYANHPQGWFCVCGSVGAGKTHLCTAICGKFLQDGIDTRYMLWRDVSRSLKACVNDDAAYNAIMSPLKAVRVLYIDDLFKGGGAPTRADIDLAFELVNSRYNDANKLTLISSELTPAQLVDIDAALGSRIYERAKDFTLILRDKQNWRLRDA